MGWQYSDLFDNDREIERLLPEEWIRRDRCKLLHPTVVKHPL